MVRNALLKTRGRLLLLYLILGFTISQAQEQSASGAASLSLADANLLLADEWSVNNNPAMLTALQEISLAAAFRNQFLLPEFSSRSFALNLPIKNQHIGLAADQKGFSEFLGTRLGLSYAQSLSPSFSMGMQFNYQSLSLADPYGQAYFLTVNLGFFTKISDELELATLVVNPNRSNTPNADQAFAPQIIKTGLAYHPEEYLSIYLQADKQLDRPLESRLGIQYAFQKAVHCRLGIAPQTRKFAFGFDYLRNAIKLAVASQFHLQLGFSPVISISYFPKHDHD